jgi:hypothetical protein
LVGIFDVILVALGFEAAYKTRVRLHLEHVFYLMPERKALVLAVSLAA